MKRSFLGIIFVAIMVVFTACNAPQNIDPNQTVATAAVGNQNNISPNQLPNAVQAAISQDFAGQTVLQAAKATGSEGTHMYSVTMSNQAKAAYNETGKKCTILEISQLPQVINDYVTKNYVGTNISQAAQVPDVNSTLLTLVVMSTQQVLTFDAANNFLTTPNNGNSKDNEGDDDDDDDNYVEDSIAVSALPQAVRGYVAANYVGQTITEAYKKTLQDGTVLYKAELSNGVSLVFDANGKFIKEEKEDSDDDTGTSQTIAVTDLPQAAQDYLKTHYATNTVVEVEKETSAAGVVSYEVELNDGTEVEFDAAGNFVKAEKD